jgi:hypothetical protein
MEIAQEKLYGYRVALPQVASALLFARERPPALLLAPEERLKRYRDLAAFGAPVYVNPGLEALEERALFVMSYEEALSPFPEDPEAWRLVLEVGRAYSREKPSGAALEDGLRPGRGGAGPGRGPGGGGGEAGVLWGGAGAPSGFGRGEEAPRPPAQAGKGRGLHLQKGPPLPPAPLPGHPCPGPQGALASPCGEAFGGPGGRGGASLFGAWGEAPSPLPGKPQGPGKGPGPLAQGGQKGPPLRWPRPHPGVPEKAPRALLPPGPGALPRAQGAAFPPPRGL